MPEVYWLLTEEPKIVLSFSVEEYLKGKSTLLNLIFGT